jgi:hypothetical protein
MAKLFTQKNGYEIRCDRCLLTTEDILRTSETPRPHFETEQEMADFAAGMGFTTFRGYDLCRTCNFVGKVLGL